MPINKSKNTKNFEPLTATEAELINAVSEKPELLEFIKNQTDGICLAAINKKAASIKFVKNQTEELCLAAINKSPTSIKHIKDQTEEMCFAAVTKSPRMLAYCNIKTDKILSYVKKNDKNSYLKYADNIGVKELEDMVRDDPYQIRLIKKSMHTEKMAMIIASKYNSYIEFLSPSVLTDAVKLKALKVNPSSCYQFFVKNSSVTNDMSLLAIKKEPSLFCYAPNAHKTEAMYLAGVSTDGMFLKDLVKEIKNNPKLPSISDDVINTALRQNGLAIQFVAEPSFEQKKLAVDNYAPSIVHTGVKNLSADQLENLVFSAINSGFSSAIQYLKKPSMAICMAAVSKSGGCLKHIKNQTEAMCLAAVQQSGDSIQYVKNQTDAIKMEAVKQNGFAIKYITAPSEDIKLAAVSTTGAAISAIKSPSRKIITAAIASNGLLLENYRSQTKAMAVSALFNNFRSFNFVKQDILNLITDNDVKKIFSKGSYFDLNYCSDKKIVITKVELKNLKFLLEKLNNQDLAETLSRSEKLLSDKVSAKYEGFYNLAQKAKMLIAIPTASITPAKKPKPFI